MIVTAGAARQVPRGGPTPALLLAGALLAAACGPAGPRPIALGRESCTRCHMTVMQERFSAEAITATGKTYVFDDVGCLAVWLAGQPEAPASSWVWSAVPGEGWLPAREAIYVLSDSLRTPMGSHLAAARPGAAADSLRAALGGAFRTWDQVRGAPHDRPAS